MSRINGDLYITGTLGAKSFTPASGSVTDNAIAGSAGNYVNPNKIGQQRRPGYSQPNTTATTETRSIFTMYGLTGSIFDFRAGSIAPCSGAATITVDLKKNGTSILTGVLTLNSSSVARVAQAATIATAGLVAGDWLEVVITATAGGGTLGTGFFCQSLISEDPQ